MTRLIRFISAPRSMAAVAAARDRSALRRLGVVIGLASISLLLAAGPAAAAPSFDLELHRETHEEQQVIVKATAGQFKLTFGGDSTADLSVGATPAEVQAALNALPSISTGNGSVSVTLGSQGGSYVVTFGGGPLANTDVAELTGASGTTPLSGGFNGVSVLTTYQAGVSRSDERADYTVKVKNTAAANTPPVVGDTLGCAGAPPYKTWTGAPTTGEPALSFTFQWMRNGVPIIGATANTYTLTSEDSEKAIQCVVSGTVKLTAKEVAGKTPKEIVSVSHSVASQPPVVVNPQPAPLPPAPLSAIVAASRPTVAGTLMAKRTCTAPTNWTAGTSFAFQWLRNGVPIPGASANEYTPVEGEDNNKILQCQVTGTNAGPDAAVGISLNSFAGTLESPGAACGGGCGALPSNAVAQTPFVTGRNDAFGLATVEVALPGGLQTTVLSASGTNWSCTAQSPAGVQPAKATCTSSGVVAPGSSYPTLTVAAGPGGDAPDHAVVTATISGGGAAAQSSDTDEFDFTPRRLFGIEALGSEVSDSRALDYTQAGGHPYAGSISMVFSTRRTASGDHFPIEQIKNIITDLPRGFVGNALAVPKLCPSIDDVVGSTCPPESAVGEINLDVAFGADYSEFRLPIFAIEPEFGAPAQFAFAETVQIQTPFTLTPRLRADDGYAISLDATAAPTSPALRRVNWASLCSFGAKVTGNTFEGCKTATDPTANPVPLITNPTRCAGQPPTVRVRADSWAGAGNFKSAESVDPPPTGCEKVDFLPEVDLRPTSRQADSPTGLDVEITVPTDGLEDPKGLAQANLDNATITFPKGMSVNPASAHGLSACTPAQVKMGSNADDECPLSSRVGTVEIDTPLIRETLTGHVYLASQKDNPFKSTVGLYMVFSSKKDGITIKVAGKLVPDPVTGQLTSIFTESPEAPFSRLALKFNSGPRAPLINPPMCGTYAIHSELSPWSAVSPANPTPEEIVAEDSEFEVTQGPNGAPCPEGKFDPKLDAGLRNATAGSKSPFVLKLSRDDGTQRFTALDMSMPPGLTAYLKGIPYCPEHVLAGISGAELTGRPELANPACPAASQVGTVEAGAGAGPFPFYAPGKAYLAGPYKGAPVSMVIVTPAVAGPFDLGNVVVRNALYIHPVTSQVTVKSDPIPTILHGLLLDVRDIRVNVDRPSFTAAPTNCEPKSIGVSVGGQGGASANLTKRFQVGDCAALGFKPKLALRLFGGTKRGAHPRLKATLTARAGDANIAGASVALPHSEFLDQAHIRTICTRVQFAAKACPQGAIYGQAQAVTPLLDSPLSGPVYLRSSDNPLPDLVAALRGPDNQPIEVVLAGRIDSVHGGIRNTFDVVPDQPVSTFTLNMQGGKKGLLVNSRNICKSVNRATAKFSGQNGKALTLRPKLQNSCKKAPKKAKKQGHRSGR